MNPVVVYAGEALQKYNFGADHPFGSFRYNAFMDHLVASGLVDWVDFETPEQASEEEIALFHTQQYIQRVKYGSQTGSGFLDNGDTPAFPGVYEAAATVVGTVLKAIDDLIYQRYKRAFVPIAGLHHAARDSAAGFCVFNDCGVAIEVLRQRYGINRVAYVDIDAHHGDGVFYAFETDPNLIFVDLHEDGRHLYPGTGHANETGKGDAEGTKLNIPMPPYADDNAFSLSWQFAEAFLKAAKPEFIIFQCGVDSIDGDPITHMRYSEKSHAHTVESLCLIADEYAEGRLLALGGGGYNLDNIAKGWGAVVDALIRSG